MIGYIALATVIVMAVWAIKAHRAMTRKEIQQIIEIDCHGAELHIENPSLPGLRAHCMEEVGATFTVEFEDNGVIQNYREN
jgi:hypothetical protein